VNRFGWFMLTLFFALGVFAFWSIGSHRRVVKDEDVVSADEFSTTARPTLQVPVAGVAAEVLTDTWGQSRASGARTHEAIDIPAPGGTPVLAAMTGRVEKMFESKDGGTTLYIRSVDGRWMTYYAHLAGYAPGIAEGQPVVTGQRVGIVGDTGNAGAGNTHLHFALNRMAAGERWYQGTAVNPYPYLAQRPVAR